MEINELIQQRKAKSEALRRAGIALYPSKSPVHSTIASVLADFKEGGSVSVCGRIMAKRLHGKALFLDLRDSTAWIQIYIKEDFIGKDKFALLENIDIADIIQVKGELFKTRTGEPTLKAEEFTFLSKALRPLPEKWHGLKDTDSRYRQRYLDLISSEGVSKVFRMRSRIIQAMRDFLDRQGFQEVETPMMHEVAGGAAGRPFKTYHNEYHLDLYLRIAPELYLKRLLVGGLDRVYEINRSFRNEGVSSRHNPEFSMLEVYQAYADYEEMMRLAEGLIVAVAEGVLGKTKFSYQGREVDLALPWQRYSFAGIVREKFGIAPEDGPSEMLEKLKRKGFAKENTRLTRSQVAKVIEDILEEGMKPNPTFVTDYFTNLCPLAKARRDNPLISERFELYIAGLEIGNAYSELNDPLEQKRRLEEEVRELGPEEKKEVDSDYILALEHGMPPAGGLGIGIDRLVMLLTDQPTIREVILFPLLRPQSETDQRTNGRMFCELWISRRYLGSGQKQKIISLTALISVVGIAIGVMVLIVVIAVMSGFDIYLQDKMVGTGAHLFLEFYRADNQPYILVEDLKKIPHVLAAAPIVAGQAFIRQGQNIFGLELRGVDPKLQTEVSKIKEYMKFGDMNVEGQEAVLGEELAYRLNAGIGDTVSLISPVTLSPSTFKVKGIFNTGMYQYDSSLVLTSLKAAQDFFKTTGTATSIAVKVDDLYRVEKIKEDICRKIPGCAVRYEVRTWADTNRNFLNALKLEKAVMFIVVTMTTVVAAFGIVSTLIMSVMSKVRDIGILRAVGAKAKNILSIFLFQGISLGIGGIILGILSGMALSLSLNRIIDFISGLIGRRLIPADIYYFDRIPTNINAADVTLIVLCALIISLAASLYPAYYATRINPNEAIRHE